MSPRQPEHSYRAIVDGSRACVLVFDKTGSLKLLENNLGFSQ
jgi:hypothetical protein